MKLSITFLNLIFLFALSSDNNFEAQKEKFGLIVKSDYNTEIIIDEDLISNDFTDEWVFFPFRSVENYSAFVKYVKKNINYNFLLPKISKIFEAKLLKDCYGFIVEENMARYESHRFVYGFFMNMKTNDIFVYFHPQDWKKGYTASVPIYRIEVINQAISVLGMTINNKADAINLSVYLISLLSKNGKITVINTSANFSKEFNNYKVVILYETYGTLNRFFIDVNEDGTFTFKKREKKVDEVWKPVE